MTPSDRSSGHRRPNAPPQRPTAQRTFRPRGQPSSLEDTRPQTPALQHGQQFQPSQHPAGQATLHNPAPYSFQHPRPPRALHNVYLPRPPVPVRQAQVQQAQVRQAQVRQAQVRQAQVRQTRPQMPARDAAFRRFDSLAKSAATSTSPEEDLSALEELEDGEIPEHEQVSSAVPLSRNEDEPVPQDDAKGYETLQPHLPAPFIASAVSNNTGLGEELSAVEDFDDPRLYNGDVSEHTTVSSFVPLHRHGSEHVPRDNAKDHTILQPRLLAQHTPSADIKTSQTTTQTRQDVNTHEVQDARNTMESLDQCLHYLPCGAIPDVGDQRSSERT